MNSIQKIKEFLIKSGYEKVHFGLPEDQITPESIKSNAEDTVLFLQRRMRQADIILSFIIAMLITLFILFVWLLLEYRDKFDITELILGNGISAGIFGWLLIVMKNLWKEKNIAEIAIYILSSRELTVEELLKIIALIKDSQ